MKNNRRFLTIALAALLLVVVAGAGLIIAEEPLEAIAAPLLGDDDEDEAEGPDEPITGEALERASQAALDYLGEGEVTDSEVGDEEGYYEVEVTLEDGSEVDVHLDENFNILSEEAEDEEDDD